MKQQSFMDDGIAIIGMAGRFPGAPDVETFWKNICAGVESVRFFTDAELAESGAKCPTDSPHYVKARGVVAGADLFDAEFFGMTPREAALTDPQQRLFLECASEALESAGCDPERYSGLVGVFAGAGWNSYLWNNLASHPDLREQVGTHAIAVANQRDYLPVRVSYKLNLRGPGVAIQNACATSLSAVCVACQNLLLHQCNVALAGGVSISFPQVRGYWHEEGGVLSPDGHCRPFDAKAGGTLVSDGVGVVVLKRLADALAEGDFVYAVIKGFALTNDGALKMGFAAPGVDGQAAAVVRSHEMAGIQPDSLGYIEAHGTATALGDPIEVAALTRAFRTGTMKTGFCAIGSVKANLGHLDAAAGVAGLIKTALALHHGVLPPAVNYQSPNPKIDFARSPFFVNTQLRDWKPGRTPRRAGVNAFGMGGANVHVVLEECPAAAASKPPSGPQLLTLSAKTAPALDRATSRLCDHLERNPRLPLADVAFTLQTGRREFTHRRIVTCRSVEEAVKALRSGDASCVQTRLAGKSHPSVAFLFPGQGAQAVNMGRGLYLHEPVFAEMVDHCSEVIGPRLGLDLRRILYPDAEHEEEAKRQMARTLFAQPALFVVEYAQARLWMSWGVKPAAMLGHSLGEYVAACLAGVFSLDTALGLITERARLAESLPAGAMMAVRLPEADVVPLLGKHLSLSAVNAPANCTVSGSREAIAGLQGELLQRGVPCRLLAVERAFHSSMVDDVLERFARFAGGCERNAPQIPVISNVTGKPLAAEEAVDPGYWARHMRSTVRFKDGLGLLLQDAGLLILEAGTRSALTGFARLHPGLGDPSRAIPSGTATGDQDETDALLLALGRVWLAGVSIDWSAVHAGWRPRRIPLPTYPFERKRHWIEPATAGFHLDETGGRERSPGTPSARDASPANATAEPAVEQPPAPGMHREPPGVARLKALIAELSGLDLSGVSGATMFLELDFDSLFLTQVANAIEKRFGKRIAFHQLMGEFPSFGALAAHLEAPSPGATAPPADSSEALVKRGVSGRKANHFPPASHEQRIRLPLTDAQREIWYATQMSDAASCAFNESRLIQLRGQLDLEALRAALQQLVDRHEALRATFTTDGEAQFIHPRLKLDVPVSDLSADGASDRQIRLQSIEHAEAGRAFDLVSGPLVRAQVARLNASHHVLFLTVHHIVCDGHSWGVLLNDLAAAYSARCGVRPDGAISPARMKGGKLDDGTPLQFGAFVQQLERDKQSARQAAAEAWWMEQFSGEPPVLDLPADRPRPKAPDFAGGREQWCVPAAVCRDLKQFSARHGCTLFTTLLAAWILFLQRIAGREDVVVGIPVAARAMDGGETLVGHCLDFLPLRVRFSGRAPFLDCLEAVKQAFLLACEHRQCAYGRLLQRLDLPRDPSSRPLVQVTFNLNRAREPWVFAGLETDVRHNRRSFSTFDLSLNLTETGDELWLDCRYGAAMFDGATIRRWLGHYQTLIEAMIAGLGQCADKLPLMNAAERARMLVEWNDTALEYPRNARLHELFEEQARLLPGATALVWRDQRWTYAELNRRSDQLARQLREWRIGPGTLVGLCTMRTPMMVAAMLAILKAGGAYVPLDPAYPEERLAFILKDTGAPVLLTTDALVDQLKPKIPGLRVVCLDALPGSSESAHRASPIARRGSNSESEISDPRSSDLAYVIYTSGSTGRPKGVAIEHRNAVAFVHWAGSVFSSEELAGVLASTSICFDLSVFELFVPLSRGGAVYLADNVMQLPGLPARNEVRLINTVPSAMRELVRLGGVPDSVRTINLAGEPLPTALVRQLLELPGVQTVHDLYGPSETTTYSTFSRRGPEGPATIGRPIANTQVYILDRNLEPVPVGVPGELFIGGAGVARGYLHRPELTAEKFIPNPFSADSTGRLYRTGDLARYREDGNIEFLGRLDDQVKIRGFRVEPGEVEAVLEQHPGVGRCATTVQRQEDGQAWLVAFVVPASNRTAPMPDELRRHLLQRLPDYMVPSAFVLLDELPLMPNGKVNRHALPAPVPGTVRESAFVAPCSPTEEALASIWRDVLGVASVGVHDDFFDLGGHSLRLTQVLVRVREVFDLDLPLRALFEARTISAQSALIEARLIEEIQTTHGSIPFSPADGRGRPASVDGDTAASSGAEDSRPGEREWYGGMGASHLRQRAQGNGSHVPVATSRRNSP